MNAVLIKKEFITQLKDYYPNLDKPEKIIDFEIRDNPRAAEALAEEQDLFTSPKYF